MIKILVSGLIFIWTVGVLATGPDVVMRDLRLLKSYVESEVPSLIEDVLQRK